jgi:hypothetical protein
MLHLLQILSLTAVAATVPATSVEVGPVTQAPQRAGLEVVIDPATGQIIDDPTDLQLERVSEGIALERRRSPWELREFFLSSGGRGVYLDGWADHSLTVNVGPDGEMRLGCSKGDQHSPKPATVEEEAIR